jgi:hypothetical protein
VFEEFMGIPAHPLLVHAAVVFVPLLAVLSVAYAVAPIVRPHTRWVLGLLALATPAAAFAAKLSGDAFFARLRERNAVTPEFAPTIENHQDLGNLTLYSSIALGVVTLALVYVVRPQVAAEADNGIRSQRALSLALAALAVIAAGVSLYYVIRTGDSGAKAVWTGS